MWAALAARLSTTQQPWAAAVQPALQLLLVSRTGVTPSPRTTTASPLPWAHHTSPPPKHHHQPWWPAARWLSQCSCPGLGGPPPERLFIEYDPEDVEAFIAVADGVEELLPGVVVDGNVDSDGRPASFEVTTPDGTVVFSRLQNGRLPSAQELAAAFALPPQDG